jgi:hypothetical protein
MRGTASTVSAALAVALLTLLTSVGCSSGSRPAARASALTVTKTFRAYAPNGDLAVPVGDVATGSCWTTSIAAPVAGAFRCIAENRIYDPCFAPARATPPIQVACLPAPWARAEVLRISGALPRREPLAGSPRPWAIVLANGARCVAATGTVPEVAGVVLGFHCSSGGDAALVPGRGARAMARYGAPTATSLRRVIVTTIWRG